MRGREGVDSRLGCGACLPEVNDDGLCPDCEDEAELENFSDLDDEGDAA